MTRNCLMSSMKKVGFAFFSFFAILSLSPISKADGPVKCYQLTMPDTAATDSMTPSSRIETWCYQKLLNPAESTYIFKADEPDVRPELAMVVDANGVLTHGSLRGGELSFHRVLASEFNPFSVPLEEPQQAPTATNVDLNRLAPSSEKTLKTLVQVSEPVESMAIQVGHFESYTPNNLLPWRGYWWPQRGIPIANGPNSPLGRYDLMIQRRTGVNPGAVSWEYANHSAATEGWYGHCNGWAASAILRAEPRGPRRDPTSGVVFDVVSQKGILAERDFCASVSFFGRRNYGRPGDDPKDIYPVNFHRVITYYLGNLKKPIAIDYKSDYTVDTHLASGYSMDIAQTSPGNYTVTVNLRMHQYDHSRVSTPGVAPIYTRTYRYTLREDASGNLVGGTWLSANPDFIWVPLSPSMSPTCNPRVTENWVRTILNLP